MWINLPMKIASNKYTAPQLPWCPFIVRVFVSLIVSGLFRLCMQVQFWLIPVQQLN